jgi:tetratricopeptide (TPR) repeat protein
LDPNSADAYNNRGTAYDDLKEYERAIEDYNKAIELDPNYALAYDNREIARSKLEDQQAQTPTPTPTPTPPPEPFFPFYLIIFLVFCLAIGLPLIFIIYRRGKPPSGGSNQQKPSEPEDYAQKIDEYKEKMEEWEKEGYDVSELKEVLEEVKNERK